MFKLVRLLYAYLLFSLSILLILSILFSEFSLLQIAVLLVAVVIVSAKPKPVVVAPLAYSAPIVAGPSVVTATSSQYVARNHNVLAAPILSAPLTYAAYSAPIAYPAAYVL